MSDIRVIRVERLDVTYQPRPWPFAEKHRTDIEAYFKKLQAEKPALWNGRVLLLHDYAFEGAIFRGAALDTDFASFITWRDWGFPDSLATNFFAMGAVRSRDGAFLLGVMGSHTINAGKVYFPAGTPDPGDLVGDRVDLAGSVMRELTEETGLGPADVEAEDRWHCVLAGRRIAHIKILHAPETAEALRERILASLARERQPELADIRIVRGPTDLHPMMPPFVTAFLSYVWR